MTKITHVSITQYGSTPSGNASISFDGGTMSLELDKEICEKVFAIINNHMAAKKAEMANAIHNIAPMPLLGYDSSRTIDNDEMPF